MKGIIYEVKYVEGVMDLIHGGGYISKVIHIPDIKAEVNKYAIREENDSYTEIINDMMPVKCGDIEIDEDDAIKIKSILDIKSTVTSICDKYMEKIPS